MAVEKAKFNVTPWGKDTPPEERELLKLLKEEGLSAYRWANGPGDIYGTHSHGYHKVIYVILGSITFGLPDTGENVKLQSGDRLDLPAGIRHNAEVGANGVACFEAHC